MRTESKVIFVSGPFTQALVDKHFDEHVQAKMELILSLVRSTGYRAFSAHERESWGTITDNPETLARIDLDQLHQCTHMIIYVGTVESWGVFIELGAAIAWRKRVLVIRHAEQTIASDFYRGLIDAGLIQEVVASEPDQLPKVIRRFLQSE